MKLTIAGESHGKAICGILTNVPSGIVLDENFINGVLSERCGAYGRSERQKFENDKISICIKAAYTQEKVDTKKLEEDYPDLVCNYMKKVNVKESVQITLKKQKEIKND